MPNAHRIIFPILLLASGLTVAISERRSTAQGQDAGQARTGVASPGIGQSYLTHLSTDKPIYRAGESLYLRGVLLHARDHRPMQQGACLGSVEIRGPKGDRLASSMVQVQGSLLGFKWTVPEGIAGGEYRIRVSYPGYGYAPAERRFQIRSFRAPRLKSQILFVRDGYGPGDRVAANLSVERAEGGLPAGAQVTIIARVDGQEIYRGRSMVDPTGHCRAAFGLPERIREGDGTLAFVIADGGIQETATKTIPILLQTLDLQLYPEGGDLVAGLPTRIYFQARTPAKKPADVAGVVVDQNGKVVSRFRSAHEGRGRFHFRPVAGASYELELRQPAGISRRWKLPEIKEQGVVLRSFADRYGPGDTLRLSIGSTEAGRFRVALRKRGEELAARWVRVRAGRMELIRFMPIEQADGVLIATVEDERGRPLAERLVFAAPAKELRVQIALDRERYVPGDQVELTLRTTDGSGAPVGAIVGLEATDDSVLELIEKREQAPRLPAMVFLEQEVQELGDAHVYLDPKNPQAPLALDLLLGTQGWRRFAFRNVEDFLAKGGDRARQVVALFIAPRPRSTALRRRGMRPLEKKKMNGLDPIDGHKAPAEEAEAPAIAVDREGDKVARKQEEVAKLAAEVQAKPQAGQAFRLEQR
ncbi:MAG: MG2 domain-containing protein, partial [Planctomycetota bacterium]